MKLSVIIPYYRGISYLRDCLESLTEQSFQDFEIILVCDNVQEDISAIMQMYQKTMIIKYCYFEEHKGVAAARNHGLTVATGEYIYFLDCDDFILPDTLSLLVAKADRTGADLVYGRNVGTWVKKSVFTEFLDSNTLEAEDTTNSIDLSDTMIDLEDGTNPFTEHLTRLFAGKKGVRNVTVLNKLIKRAFIEEYDLKFSEKIKFLSDYPFLLQVIMVAKGMEYVPQAIYMKRIHGEASRYPALLQMKGNRSFHEYTETYLYASNLIQSNERVKLSLDQKVIDYCINYYAPRLRTNHDDPDRIKKFTKMSRIIQSISQSLIQNYRGYSRRVLKAIAKGDIVRAEKVVNRHMNLKEFRKVTKNRRTFYIFLYQRFFLKTRLKQNYVLCESFFGKSYSNNPKYVYEYIARNYPGKYKFIWVIQDKKTNIPYPHKKIRRYGLRYVYYLARSKYYIFNGRQPDWIIKRKGNIFLQTWHGTPLKRLVFDLEDINAATVRYKNKTYKQSRCWDYLVSANKYSSDIFRRCFKYEKTILETGYPRNDLLHASNKLEIADQVKEKLGLPSDKKIILYAPTWRDDEYYTKGRYKFSLELDLDLLKERLSKEYVILLRTHYFIADEIDITGYEEFAYDVSKYDDISELFLISDILITDYSSVFFDYANLKRPMLFFTYDLDKYRDLLRGFYIDIEEELPGPLLFTTEEIIGAVQNIDELQFEYKDKYFAFYQKYCAWEDGQAAKRVAEAVFQLKGDNDETDY